jgi:hypothetical protein
VGFVALAAVAASVMIDGGDVVWWSIAPMWKAHQAVYNILAWVVAGAVLCRYMPIDGEGV